MSERNGEAVQFAASEGMDRVSGEVGASDGDDSCRTDRVDGILTLRSGHWELRTAESAVVVVPDKKARSAAGQGWWEVTHRNGVPPSVSRLPADKVPKPSARRARRTTKQLKPADRPDAPRTCATCRTKKPAADFKKPGSSSCRDCASKVKARRRRLRRTSKGYPEISGNSVRTVSGGLPGSSRRH